jgi:uncharacterized Zn finger protein
MSRWDYHRFFEPSIPRQVKGGIRAQSKRGTFGESWWARRWGTVLESFEIGARLNRGRNYARSGQVLSIEIEKGRVKAKVQGSRPKPYEVTIQIKTIPLGGWQKLATGLSRQAIFLAKLFAGEMPQDIEKVFRSTGLSVFPERLKDLKTDCSCPDWSNPCKHIAAVYFLLGEEFDRDPFLIFKLRGMGRDELINILSAPGKKTAPKKPRAKKIPTRKEEEIILSSEPLPADISDFWKDDNLPDGFPGEVEIPSVPAAIAKRLGNFPFWRSKERFLDALEGAYEAAAARGLDVFLAEGPRRRLEE